MSDPSSPAEDARERKCLPQGWKDPTLGGGEGRGEGGEGAMMGEDAVMGEGEDAVMGEKKAAMGEGDAVMGEGGDDVEMGE